MTQPITFAEVEESGEALGFSEGSSAPRLDSGTVTVRCRLHATDDAGLEALRYARRAMLREEWTRGREEGEPSLEDAVFSAFEVVWVVSADCRVGCRAKLDELLARANRVLADLPPGRHA